MEPYQNESLVEIALLIMKTKKRPKPLKELTTEVFQAKGITAITEEMKAQFQLDFMLSGHFVCCGENKNGHKLWDLKNRQPSTLLDKDGNYLEDLYADDEDVLKHELKDDFAFVAEGDKSIDDFISDDEEESDEEEDEIEEELGLVELDSEDELAVTTEIVVESDDDEEDEEEDEIEIELQDK
ncbi:MAG: DNA-directed RNA polymerase subunit delta [Bacilli bacterium]|jgi:DNA-directed RNA polymerase delta subunit|nr:DNA-directed RNA polymerase subunit delta [Bacilli bacterium]MDY0064402.1 DNA-directed RNA polymerase subunit delta [Bacilli bacterium]